MGKFRFLGGILLGASLAIAQTTSTITGTVKNSDGLAIAGASVSLELGGQSTTTDANGAFSLATTTLVIKNPGQALRPWMKTAFIKNGFLNIQIEKSSSLNLSLWNHKGAKLLERSVELDAGWQKLALDAQKPGIYFYQIQMGEDAFYLRAISSSGLLEGQNHSQTGFFSKTASAKQAAAAGDVLVVTADGYVELRKNVTLENSQNMEIELIKEGELPNFSFFVTSLAAMRRLSGSQDGFGGDLRYGEATGLAGADKICTEIAETSMPGSGAKSWRAFLSVSEGPEGTPIHAIDRVGNGPWYDRLGRLIAENKDGLLAGDRPAGDMEIIEDLPNEDGVPNKAPEGTEIDNHDVLTGSDENGQLDGKTCDDWTSVVTDTTGVEEPPDPDTWPPTFSFGNGPNAGHSWVARSGTHWIMSHNVAGCAPSVVEGQGSFGGNGVGDGGGYGGIYCFALSP